MDNVTSRADASGAFSWCPTCPLCDAASLPAFMAADYRMYRCTGCRTAFVNPVPGPEELAAFYSRFHRGCDKGGWYDDVETRMQADFPAKVQLVKRFLGRQPARVLDVGCGKGFFVKACCDSGIAAEGIDPADSGVRYATECLHVKATCGPLADQKDRLGQFDAITCWATIEHLADPRGLARDIYALLRPGGYLFMDTGHGDDWLEHLLPGQTQWYDPPQHLFVFSDRGLRLLLESERFKVVRFDGCFERSAVRRSLRIVRNGAFAVGVRMIYAMSRIGRGTFLFTRFAVGNTMIFVAQK